MKSAVKRSKPERTSAQDPYQQALGLLVRREHSRRELSRKLAVKGVDPQQAAQALDVLAGQGFQNDERYARAFARTRASAGYGPVRIRAELATHALGNDAVVEALEACETDWAASASEIIARRYRSCELADPAKRRKAVEFLLRRGFRQDDAYAAVRAAGQALYADGD